MSGVAGLRYLPEDLGTEPCQPALFEASPAADDGSYRGPQACSAAGITYRQLDYWARTGLVTPSVCAASGSGTQRLYSFRDVLVLRVVKRLLDAGVSLHNVRAAIDYLRRRGAGDLSSLTLLSDGATVYDCSSDDEVIDLLASGQGVFGIAIGRVAREIEGVLARMPSTPAPAVGTDELATRRRRRAS